MKQKNPRSSEKNSSVNTAFYAVYFCELYIGNIV